MSLLPQVDVFAAFAVVILVGCVSVFVHDFGLRKGWWSE